MNAFTDLWHAHTLVTGRTCCIVKPVHTQIQPHNANWPGVNLCHLHISPSGLDGADWLSRWRCIPEYSRELTISFSYNYIVFPSFWDYLVLWQINICSHPRLITVCLFLKTHGISSLFCLVMKLFQAEMISSWNGLLQICGCWTVAQIWTHVKCEETWSDNFKIRA